MAQPVNNRLPVKFAVNERYNGRDGYRLLNCVDGDIDNTHGIVHILHCEDHGGRFYRINTNTNIAIPTGFTTTMTKKASGRVNHLMHWKRTRITLHYDANTYPVIQISNISNMRITLPVLKVRSFIPIVEEVPQENLTPPTAPTMPPVPIPPLVTLVVRKPVTVIPQHAVRALLRDAAMQEEVCPITDHEIDVSNGAVTSCFHLFEKTAIDRWLKMPTSRNKCPVCNSTCSSYTLIEELN